MRTWWRLLVAGALLTGCTATAPAAPRAAAALSPTTTPGVAGTWPSTDPGAAVSCVSRYPERLAENAVAFDGTVTGVRLGDRDEDAGGTPARVELAVHETFAGPRRTSVVMRTWDFMLPDEADEVVGLRGLFAAGPTLDIKACGYSRPHSPQDAVTWRRAFRLAPDRG